MAALLLLVLLTLTLHRLLLQPFSLWLQPLSQSSWAVWVVLLLGVWLFAAPRRNP